jgi:nucleoredoxin
MSGTWTELFGETSLTKHGEVSTQECLGNSTTVGIYFSVHWCPSSRQFTPILSKQYEEAYDCKGLKVVFVSSDHDDDKFNAYYGEMPFFALPFSRRGHKETLSVKYGVPSIPTLALLKPDGMLITNDGRACVIKDPMGEAFPWHDGPQTIGASAGGVLNPGQTTGGTTEQFQAARRRVLYGRLAGMAVMIVLIGL